MEHAHLVSRSQLVEDTDHIFAQWLLEEVDSCHLSLVYGSSCRRWRAAQETLIKHLLPRAVETCALYGKPVTIRYSLRRHHDSYIVRDGESDVGSEEQLPIHQTAQLGALDAVVDVADRHHVPAVRDKGEVYRVDLWLLALAHRLQDKLAANQVGRVAQLWTPSPKPGSKIWECGAHSACKMDPNHWEWEFKGVGSNMLRM